MEITIELIALVVSIIAVCIAFWQAKISKDQLTEAKETKKDTSDLLDKIKEKVATIESTTKTTEDNIKTQISSLIENQNSQIQTLLSAPQQQQNTEMAMALIKPLMENNPEILGDILKNATKK